VVLEIEKGQHQREGAGAPRKTGQGCPYDVNIVSVLTRSLSSMLIAKSLIP